MRIDLAVIEGPARVEVDSTVVKITRNETDRYFVWVEPHCYTLLGHQVAWRFLRWFGE